MIKHRVKINVSDQPVLKGGQLSLPRKMIRWLFGDFQQIYLISPGKTIKSIDIQEVEDDERNRCAA